ncbi:sentrin-specific protease 1 [Marchantia polymorpha subsp. ruderalis]|uniref:Ubiquitin-like protease family profile domain-containing protein n=2 Tax=Marchantia polymorpha TaxID=3197 RepID=A0A176VNP7_MARPO|nr:hypothetical protein AXG93_3988s1070 [Marchantia polymorpha subsp. ruderalis]PTQ35522.1 hypothetical protein MARPO_0071s0122 [Marchantia polymorpha]PTQ35523.1 hypothetical protein MARPO_0071s0122 [Marchantia polymorpha]BBN11792.1 hypothetical protein Mp_5g14790 [Marchantia polymorpha subsp. ruderalis]BBN11793.1 hypothetical protein Mp_5g14790 [Marchantia polymorpha subsp. ruderalis]|eukprot:PTQ35522.1 hypothetical protein MARPO_0071s0122 [Marchantia polymorpha]
MVNNLYKRRLDDMYDQSSLPLSTKRKKAHLSNSSPTSDKGQHPKKSFLQAFEDQYKIFATTPLSRMRHGTSFAVTGNSPAGRPLVAQGSSFVAGSHYECPWTPRTPRRQRHYSPRRPWNNHTVAGISARSPVNVLGLCSTPEVLSSATVSELPSHLARSSFGPRLYSSLCTGRGADWSDAGKKLGVSKGWYRLTTDMSETRLNDMCRERLVSKELPESIVLSKLKDENRALEKKLHAVRPEPRVSNNLSSGRTEDVEQLEMSELDSEMLKAYRQSIASIQGDEKRLADISKTCSNLQEARYVSPDSVLSKAVPVMGSDSSGEISDVVTQQGRNVADHDKLASRIERGGDSHFAKPDDWRALYDRTKSYDPKLEILKLEAEFAEKQLAALSLRRPTISKAKKDVKDVAEAFTPLSEEAEEDIDDALQGSDRSKVLTFHKKSSIDVTRAVMQCLLPGAWLNDEVINLYMELLKEREVQEPKKFLKCHFFNTFFYNKLFKDKRSYDYKAVRRWTTQKKLGYSLSDCDKILVPIHQDIHWCLAVINIRDKKLEYLDSLQGGDNTVLKVLARYIADEAKDKDGKVLDSNTWEHNFPQDIPQQLNGCDCGMFMLKYADFHSRGVPLSFKQGDMPYFRRRLVWELLQLKAT